MEISPPWLLLLGLIGCRSPGPEERTLSQVFAALKEGDVQAFEDQVVTAADFELRAQNLRGFKAKQSFAGAVLKPEELAHMRERFTIARRGGPGFIDFSNTRFLGLGTLLDERTESGLLDSTIPCRTYSLRLESASGEIDTKDLVPRFVLAEWGSFYKLIQLDLGAADLEPP